nr:hypothetical protein [uncultured Flavobacterium sp.]
MTIPFIHPDILLTVRRNVMSGQFETLDTNQIEKTKNQGHQSVNDIIQQLFHKIEYGKIESHFNTERLNSKNFKDIREQIINLHYQRKTLGNESTKYSEAHDKIQDRLLKTKNSFFSFLLKKRIASLSKQLEQSKADLDKIREVESESYLEIKYEYESTDLKEQYSDLISAFTTMKNSEKIWDMTYSERNFETKAAAQTTMRRNEVKFTFSSIDVIKTAEKTFHFENFNGGDFFFYPSFIVYFKNSEDIAILDYNDLQINYSECQFLEERHNIASDTKVIGETWYRVNKDGSPDRRFVDNYKIPIALYGSIQLRTLSGVNELYYISDNNKARHFCEQYNLYQSLFRTSK